MSKFTGLDGQRTLKTRATSSGVQLSTHSPLSGTAVSIEISREDLHRLAFEHLGPDEVKPPRPATPTEVKPGQVWESLNGDRWRVRDVVHGAAFVVHDQRSAANVWQVDHILATWTFIRDEVTS